MYTNEYCYATRLTIGRVFHRRSWYYNVAIEIILQDRRIYTMQRQAHICRQAASSRNVDSPSIRYFIYTKKVAQVIIGVNGGMTRASRDHLAAKTKNNRRATVSFEDSNGLHGKFQTNKTQVSQSNKYIENYHKVGSNY